ncbi:IS600 ORF2 [Shigella sonnei]|nr:IS600 ORF2 [Shigella sonnei]
MGIAYKLSCHRCGYESDLLYLGQGMAMLPEQIVGTCTCCDNLTTISINESYGVCSLCGAKDRVIFTSYQHEARPRNPCYLERSFKYQCPRCHAFSMEPIEAMCQVFGVSRSGYYNWVQHEPSDRKQSDERLKLEIKVAHIRTRETYGTRRLQTELAENGIIVGRDRLARLRKELRLRCKQKRKFRATTNSNHNLPVAPNLLNQTFAPTAPNQVWVADLTYVATQEGWLYLAGIKDVYTCEIVGYAMGERMTKELTGKALFMALRSQRPPAGLIHHSDRGSQYCAYDYRVIQEQSGLKTSMSRKGNCYDNAPMESFWGTLKNESLSHYRFNNRDEAISVIREYIEIFYNRQRRHSRLGNISPAAFREKYHQMAA